MAKGRLNTDELFKNMLTPPEQKVQPTPSQEEALDEDVPSVRGRKPLKEKNIQISVYVTKEQEKELRLQSAMREKENDKSAFIRAGLNIMLGMSSETYNALKLKANIKDEEPATIVEAALKEYLNK